MITTNAPNAPVRNRTGEEGMIVRCGGEKQRVENVSGVRYHNGHRLTNQNSVYMASLIFPFLPHVFYMQCRSGWAEVHTWLPCMSAGGVLSLLALSNLFPGKL